jgi:peptidoglycan/LPS O-acetylase OafA/YrhL
MKAAMSGEAQAPSTRARRLEGIEGLRALAALSVVIYHCGQVTSSTTLGEGWLAVATTPFASGVTFFFVLSGFLLYRPFLRAFAEGGPLPGVGSYLRNRFLRIFPAYWAVLLLVVLVLGTPVIQVASPQLVTGSGMSAHTLVADGFLVQTFSPEQLGTGILPAWSLSVELSFYLLLPLFILLVELLRRRRPGTRVGVLILAAPMAFLALAVLGKTLALYVIPGSPAGFNEGWHSVLAFSILTRADAFACGMLAAVLLLQLERGVPLPPRRARLGAEVGLVALVAGLTWFGGAAGRYYGTTLLAAIFAAFMLWVVVAARREGEGRSPIATFLTSKTMLLLGLCSYSIFLWNHPLLYWLENHGLIVTGFAGFLLVGAVLAVPLLALAYCTYRWVELPALRLKSIRLTGSTAAGRTASTG